MKTYCLLFDSGCNACSEIAKDIQSEMQDKMTYRSLRDPEIQKIVNQIDPSWQWEPMVLVTDDTTLKLFRGFKMKLLFVQLLGLNVAMRLYKRLIPQISSAKNKIQQDRRDFISQAGGLTLATFAISALPKSIQIDEDTLNNLYLPLISSLSAKAEDLKTIDFSALSSEEVQMFLNKARNEDALRSFEDRLEKEYPTLKLLLHQYQVLVIDGSIVVVNFAVDSPTGHSSFELRYDRLTGVLLQTHSFLAQYDALSNIRVHCFTNEQISTDLAVSPTGQLLEGYIKTPDGRTLMVDEITASATEALCGCFYACLESLAVPAWILGALGAICAVVCACTAGAGCLACAAGVAYGYYLAFSICTISCWGS